MLRRHCGRGGVRDGVDEGASEVRRAESHWEVRKVDIRDCRLVLERVLSYALQTSRLYTLQTKSNHIMARTRDIMSARKHIAAKKRELPEDVDEMLVTAPSKKPKVEQSDENEIDEGAIYDAGDVPSVISDGEDAGRRKRGQR